jgi:hypothetical protein
MKPIYVVCILLVLSASANIYYMVTDDKDLENCISTGGYEEPTTITRDQAKLYADRYRETVDPEAVRGGVISRSAFDSMLCMKDCNAIAYTISLDETGQVGPAKGLFLTFTAIKYTQQYGSDPIMEPVNSPFYVTRNWCPPSCIPWLD